MWFCALVPDYVPRSWCIKCMCIHCKSVRIARARQTIRRTKLVLQILFLFEIDNSSPFTGINDTSAVSVNPSRLGNSRAHDHLSKEYFASSCRWKSWWFSGNDLSSECRYPSDRGIGYGEWMLCTGRIRWFRYRLLHFLKKNRLNGPVPKWFKFLKSQTQSATWSVAQQFNVDVKLELIMLIVLRTR
jgi:hypothetical protein